MSTNEQVNKCGSDEPSTTSSNECCICYEMIGERNNCVTECGHSFCLKCLVTAMSHNVACPCCRTPLVESPPIEESDDEEEESDIDDDFIDEEEDACIEDIVERIQKKGITMLDVVSILLDRYSQKDQKYTDDYIMSINDSIDDIVTEADQENYEQICFAKEDHRIV